MSMDVNNIRVEGNVSQIFKLYFSLYFMPKNRNQFHCICLEYDLTENQPGQRSETLFPQEQCFQYFCKISDLGRV